MAECTATRICVGPDCDVQLSGRQTKYCSRQCERRAHRALHGDRIREQEAASRNRRENAIKARKASWYQENAERLRAKQTAYYEANRETISEYHRGRYVQDPDAFREKSREYRKANPGRCRLWNAEYRTRKSQHSELFDPVEIFERDGWVCGICEGDIDPALSYPDPQCASLDHVIPLSRDGLHTRVNAQASHLRCNLRKNVRVVPLP